ncbi:hypothetical protein BB8028_0003g00210 [Beauveria bassiana]|uniref:Uncharacterized protein n=1 Tax=Beauveria bassiana TaxID=176275 RepID=A0A2S7Y5J9_BEABA|nr:hypothetical protein BB8028_0003g00210 [Beauveria bassiana]
MILQLRINIESRSSSTANPACSKSSTPLARKNIPPFATNGFATARASSSSTASPLAPPFLASSDSIIRFSESRSPAPPLPPFPAPPYPPPPRNCPFPSCLSATRAIASPSARYPRKRATPSPVSLDVSLSKPRPRTVSMSKKHSTMLSASSVASARQLLVPKAPPAAAAAQETVIWAAATAILTSRAAKMVRRARVDVAFYERFHPMTDSLFSPLARYVHTTTTAAVNGAPLSLTAILAGTSSHRLGCFIITTTVVGLVDSNSYDAAHKKKRALHNSLCNI